MKREAASGTYPVQLPDIQLGGKATWYIFISKADDSAKPVYYGPFKFDRPAKADCTKPAPVPTPAPKPEPAKVPVIVKVPVLVKVEVPVLVKVEASPVVAKVQPAPVAAKAKPKATPTRAIAYPVSAPTGGYATVNTPLWSQPLLWFALALLSLVAYGFSRVRLARSRPPRH